MNEKTFTIELTENEIEELLHATIMSYMDYDERLFYDKVLQAEYNQGVKKYNDMIDRIRIKLKKCLKDGK